MVEKVVEVQAHIFTEQREKKDQCLQALANKGFAHGGRLAKFRTNETPSLEGVNFVSQFGRSLRSLPCLIADKVDWYLR